MRSYHYVLSVCIIFMSCSKEDYSNMPLYFPGDTSKGYLMVKKNNQNMIASVASQMCHSDENKHTLNFNTYDNRGIMSENFVLQCLELNLEEQVFCYPREINCGMPMMFYVSVIDDQIIDQYILNTKKNNFVQITEIDTISGWISGKIEMHFDRDKSKPKKNANNPEKVSFTEGKFRVQLNN